jgi:superfamily I DNA/RNA helicase
MVALRPDDNFALRKVMDHQGHRPAVIHPLIAEALGRGCGLADLDSETVAAALGDAERVAEILNSQDFSARDKVDALAAIVPIVDPARLTSELEADSSHALEDEGEEAVETAGAARPIEMLTMVGSKGLSAHHVIVLGCDDLNMKRTSRLTFFVAMTRARKSLHLVASAKAGGEGPFPTSSSLNCPMNCVSS